MPLKNVGHSVLAAGATFYTAPAANVGAGRPDGVSVVLGLQVANRTGATGVLTVSWRDASNGLADYPIVFNIAIPSNTSLNILDSLKLVLEAGDTLYASATSDSTFVITGAISEE